MEFSTSSRSRGLRTRFLALVTVLALAVVLVPPGTAARAVVGGAEVADLNTSWSFIVKVGGTSPEQSGCGGALIDPSWVVTAQHCVSTPPTHVHHSSLVESSLMSVEIAEVVPYSHAFFRGGFDIALLRLASPLATVTPATLGTVTPVPGEKVTVAGWGATNDQGTIYPQVLNEGVATVRDEADYPDDLSRDIWAGGLSGDADACFGDSGGPLLDASGQLVGVVSRAADLSTHLCGPGGLYADLTAPIARTWLTTIVPSLAGDSAPPAVGEVTVTPDVVAVGEAVTVAAVIDDSTSGGSVVTAATVSLDGGAPVVMQAVDGAFDGPVEAVQAMLTSPTPGLSEVCVTAEDDQQNVAPAVCTALAVYDPAAGFAVGNGVVESPAWADVEGGAAGPARFAFVSRYGRGATTPSGTFQFRFEAGDVTFRSTEQSWLVVTGEPRARFRGVGLLNDVVECDYVVDAWDQSFGGDADAFGLRILGCNGADATRYDLDAVTILTGDIKIRR